MCPSPSTVNSPPIREINHWKQLHLLGGRASTHISHTRNIVISQARDPVNCQPQTAHAEACTGGSESARKRFSPMPGCGGRSSFHSFSGGRHGVPQRAPSDTATMGPGPEPSDAAFRPGRADCAPTRNHPDPTPSTPPPSAALRENQKADVLMVQLYLAGAETIPDHVLCVHPTRPPPAAVSGMPFTPVTPPPGVKRHGRNRRNCRRSFRAH